MLALFASVLIGLTANDSTPRPIKQWQHTQWTVKDGAPTETRALAQTNDGYLWLGTNTGLVRFDGVRFVPIVPPDSLRGRGAMALRATRDGSLWTNWNGLVSRFRDGTWTIYGNAQGLPHVLAFAESSAGTLIAGTANGIFRFDNGRWTNVGRERGFPSTQGWEVWFDREGTLWVQSEDRVVYLPAGAGRFIDTGVELVRRGQPADFAQTKDGAVWRAELSNSVHTMSRGQSSEPRSEVMVRSMSLLVDRKGSLWIGTATDGLRRLVDPRAVRGQRIEHSGPEAEAFTVKDGLLSDIVSGIIEDNEGNVWVATSQGLDRFRESVFASLRTTDSPRPKIVFAARDNSVWVATHNRDDIVRHRASSTDTIRTSFAPLSWFEDRSGRYWTVSDSGVHRFNGTRFERVRFKAPNNVQRFVSGTFDPAGTLWVYSDREGLLRASADSLVPMAAVHDSTEPHARIFSDRKGRIWLAESHSVAVYDNGRLTRHERRDGWPGRVQVFFEDRAGNIWGAGSNGLCKYDGTGCRVLARIHELPGRMTLGIAEDADGAWWIAVRNGVVRLPPGEAERAFGDSTRPLTYRKFDQSDGLPGLVHLGMYGPMAAATPDGKIWIATDRGVARIDPRNLPSTTPPAVAVEALRVDGREVSLSDTVTIAPRPREIEIDYTSTSLSTPERVQFRYRIESQDSAWHNVGTRRRAYYTGLGPGTHRFRVSASNGDGVWNEANAILSFRILPAWYQTLWFRVGVVLLIGALGAGVAAFVQRRRHLRAQAALKRDYEATLLERARIAQDLHDTLLQGFAGVTLQLKTAELALPERPDVAVDTIVRVQELARASLREARERVWDMREIDLGGDDLPTALEALAKERTFGTDIGVRATIAGERRRLTRSVEDAAFRIGREAIVNAVRHADARCIEIHAEFRPSSLRLEVHDDGRGFTPDEAEDARKRGHFGLTGARQRAASIGGRCDIRDRPGGGTIVGVELPLVESRAMKLSETR